jgi:hypothetical protein
MAIMRDELPNTQVVILSLSSPDLADGFRHERISDRMFWGFFGPDCRQKDRTGYACHDHLWAAGLFGPGGGLGHRDGFVLFGVLAHLGHCFDFFDLNLLQHVGAFLLGLGKALIQRRLPPACHLLFKNLQAGVQIFHRHDNRDGCGLRGLYQEPRA